MFYRRYFSLPPRPEKERGVSVWPGNESVAIVVI